MATNRGFTVHDHNPNDRIGGGGCLATGGRPHEDCRGKWINFFQTQTEYHTSPYAVICEYHLAQVIETYQSDDVLVESDVLPLRQYKPLTREETGMPAMGFSGIAGDAERHAADRTAELEAAPVEAPEGEPVEV